MGKPAATDGTDDTDMNHAAFVQDQDINSDFTGQSQHADTEIDDGLVAKIREFGRAPLIKLISRFKTSKPAATDNTDDTDAVFLQKNIYSDFIGQNQQSLPTEKDDGLVAKIREFGWAPLIRVISTFKISKPAATDSSTDSTNVNNAAFMQDQDIDSDLPPKIDDGLVAKIKRFGWAPLIRLISRFKISKLLFTKPAATDDTDVNHAAFVQDQDIDSDFTEQFQQSLPTDIVDRLVAKIQEYVDMFFG